MLKETIYDNGNSKVSIEFDGDILSIKQEGMDIGENSIYIYEDELETIYKLVKGFI
jgi:hypothetical protein